MNIVGKLDSDNVFFCPDCKSGTNAEYDRCPYCGHNCDMSAKTIQSDEDGHCNKCDNDCLQSDDGLSMEKNRV